MKKHSALFLGLGLILTAGVASAQAPIESEPEIDVDVNTIMGGPAYGGSRGYIITNEPVAEHGNPSSNVIFVNSCKNELTTTGVPGCAITGGSNDSRTNRSSIVSGTRNLLAYSGSNQSWAAILQCVQETYSPFNVVVTDVNPGNVSHFEAMAAGLPTQVGMPNGVAGVAPFSCGIINNAITFSFLNLFPSDVDEACWTIAQETAHAFGLSHEMLAEDPMTYISNPPRKSFQNQSACIGTQGCCQPSGECQCGATQQNSFQRLLDIFGPSQPSPPEIVIETPVDNSQVTPGFVVRAQVTDSQGVRQVEMLFDGAVTASLSTPPYAFNAPISVVDGTHTVGIRATDSIGSVGTAEVTVIVGDPCNDNADCNDPNLVCVDGRCVAGENVEGGLGSDCSAGQVCLSGLCATKDGQNLCSEECDPAADGCPDGYSCLNNGAGGGLCWPGDPGPCGCATSDGSPDPSLPIGAGLFLAALLVRRRRRRA
jgi:MYXO-CTERM domain-containing protein